MKKLIIFCDGGLGNRLGVLIGGILVAQKLDRVPTLCWPENNWCGCHFDDLFSSKYEVVSFSINELFAQNKSSKFIIHENQTNLHLEQYYPSLDTINRFEKIEDETVVYYHNSIPDYFNQDEILDTLAQFNIKPHIKNRVTDFCAEKSISSSTLGIHLRKTDFQSFLNEEETYNYIASNSQTNFFICSDSFETEQKFSILSNVIVYPKNHYVEKLKEGSWNASITDNEGRHFNFNVNRSKESVIEGFIDLLILSKTTPIVESHSTFLKFAKLYKNINL